jgi:hypothetical protein
MAGEGFLHLIGQLRRQHTSATMAYRRSEDAFIAAEREAQDRPADESARRNYDLKRGAFRSAEDDLADAERKLQEAIIRYNDALPREPERQPPSPSPDETKEPTK